MSDNKTGFGTAPVFFTSISTILGAILFLRFGFAVGTLGFWGVVFIVLIGHLVTIPTALAISEIATNEKVKGGGEYFIISRSFGLNIGATIGFALFLSQAISIAFYVIAFSEAFSPIFELVKNSYGWDLPKQVISIPTLLILAFIILKKGAGIGVKILYFVVFLLFMSLALFFLGSPVSNSGEVLSEIPFVFKNSNQFFLVLAIIFPAFTGMTAGVGLSGDLKEPKKSIPLGTLLGTVFGMIVYFFVVYKLNVSASADLLLGDQLIMSKIALWGTVIIPVGLAASTISSAIGSILVAPRTLQALSADQSFPSTRLNFLLSRGRGSENEPINGTIAASLIALVFVVLGDVNAVAYIITMFFMVTYGSICLISFLYHFGADPSYRPTFKSRWYLSLLGAGMSIWLMFQISSAYAFFAIIIMTMVYFLLSKFHSDRTGLESIFQGAMYQFSRALQVFLQKTKKKDQGWRPSAICISKDTFERDKTMHLLSWISYKYGFGTYIHLIEGYYSKQAKSEADKILELLLAKAKHMDDNIYFDTMISPSFTSAIAQALQLPGPSGMENNMAIFEYDKKDFSNIPQIIENLALVRSGNFDICILGSSSRSLSPDVPIHVWIKGWDYDNSNLMILLSYIILGHASWHGSEIKIFSVCQKDKFDEELSTLKELVVSGRLPISENNIEVIELDSGKSLKETINEKSTQAGLTILGFKEEHLKREGNEFFKGYDKIGDILFVESNEYKKI